MGIKSNCCGIIVAAGSSTRMSLGYSKQFVLLCGIPAIIHTLTAFQMANRIDSVVVVCRDADFLELNNYIQQYKIKKVKAVVLGGNTRQKSVAAGILAAPREATYFAIHDGARMLIDSDEINTTVEDAFRFGASALAVPVKDTIKLVDENDFVVSTPERSLLWAVQTPQVFERGIYLDAMERAKKDGADYTDDCQLVEKNGIKVHLRRGKYTNLKLTTREDLFLAETIIRNREETP